LKTTKKVCCLPAESGRQQISLNSFDIRKIIHSATETHLFYDHDHVDGVKIFFTAETSGEIGFGVSRRDEFRAKGTKKAHVTFRDLCGQFEKLFDQDSDRDLVSQLSKHFRGKPV